MWNSTLCIFSDKCLWPLFTLRDSNPLFCLVDVMSAVSCAETFLDYSIQISIEFECFQRSSVSNLLLFELARHFVGIVLRVIK